MLIVLNEHTGMSADKPRKEIIASSASELDDIEVGHGSIAYVIEDSTLNAYDEESEEWVEIQTGGGGGGGGSDLPEVTASDNGKVLSVVNGAWDKADPATELPAVTSSDNGKALVVSSGAWTKGTILPSVSSSDNNKVLTVVNGRWQKYAISIPEGGMNVLKLEVQDWGTELVLCKVYPDSGAFDNNNFDTYDAIEILNTNSLASFSYDRRRYLFCNIATNNAVTFKNLFSSNSLTIDALTAANSMTIDGISFTFNDSYWHHLVDNGGAN